MRCAICITLHAANWQWYFVKLYKAASYATNDSLTALIPVGRHWISALLPCGPQPLDVFWSVSSSRLQLWQRQTDQF